MLGKTLEIVSVVLSLLSGISFLLSAYLGFRMVRHPPRDNGNLSHKKQILKSGILIWSGVVLAGLSMYVLQEVSLAFIGFLIAIGLVLGLISIGHLFYGQFLRAIGRDMQRANSKSKTKQNESTETTE